MRLAHKLNPITMSQKPIATMRMSDDGKPDIALEIFREPEDMHNRYAIMSDTKVVFAIIY